MDDSHIPIDINTTKLLDWLISRRHVNKDWQTHIIKIREKINNAIQDMPAHDGILNLLSGQHINYFHCLKIVEILKETEADTKNLFGRYGSQRMKDWQDIIACYTKDNIYLAEAAQILMRNVSYEVPSLKKVITKCEQVQNDSEKKIKDYIRAENIALNDFNTMCKQLGIRGDKIKSELIELLKDIPDIHKVFMKNVENIKPCLEIYEAFIHFHLGKKCNSNSILPILFYLLDNGNTTTYEYTYGEKPITIEVPPLMIDTDDMKTDIINFGDDIDFGDNVQIDFGEINADNINLTSTPLSEGDIDWGTTTTEGTDEEFEIVDMNINLEESGIVVENSGLDGGVARGTDALTILDNPKTRDLVINDLMELEAFLKMRLYEMSNGNSDLLLMSQMDASSIVQMLSPERITSLNDFVTVALNDLTCKRAQHLHNIKHSPKYVDILTASLQHKLEVIERMKLSKGIQENKIKECKEKIENINPVIKLTIANTKKLQADIQEEISKKYKGRVVNIVGGINNM